MFVRCGDTACSRWRAYSLKLIGHEVKVVWILFHGIGGGRLQVRHLCRVRAQSTRALPDIHRPNGLMSDVFIDSRSGLTCPLQNYIFTSLSTYQEQIHPSNLYFSESPLTPIAIQNLISQSTSPNPAIPRPPSAPSSPPRSPSSLYSHSAAAVLPSWASAQAPQRS